MRRTLLTGVSLLAMLLAIAAVACDDDDDGEQPSVTPTLEAADTPTEEAEIPEATEPSDDTASAATLIVSEHPELGRILTDAEGRTLYTFSEDPPNVSTCQNAPCPQTWPPLTIEGGAPVAGEGVPGELGVIDRPDGSQQVTYDSSPLHYFVNDTAPGDANGQGVGGRWFVVQIEG